MIAEKTIIFMGTPEFAVPILQGLFDSQFRPVLVVTQPDAPRGRKLILQAPPVKQAAEALGLSVMQPENINAESILKAIADLHPDLIITAAYGGYLGRQLRSLPTHGCINLHPSLLPAYRGPSPVYSALRNGDTVTGMTIYHMTSRIDAGPILLQQEYQLTEGRVFTEVEKELAKMGATMLLRMLPIYFPGEMIKVRQNEDLASYTKKLETSDLQIDWTKPAHDILHQIHALAWEPGAFTRFRGQPIKILQAECTELASTDAAGTIELPVEKRGILIHTGDHLLRLTSVLPAGKRMMSAFNYSLGARFREGERFE